MCCCRDCKDNVGYLNEIHEKDIDTFEADLRSSFRFVLDNDIYNFSPLTEISYPLIGTTGTGTYHIYGNYLHGEAQAGIYTANQATTVNIINNIIV
jgi:hypothetical protein